VLDLFADDLDELEEVFGLELILVGDKEVREDFLIAFVKFVEVQRMTPNSCGLASQNTT
jgi:hypothetical protein